MAYTKTGLTQGITLHQFGDDSRSALVECEGLTLLIDCHSRTLHEEIASKGLPAPDMILHTHVQPEHCCEANTFPDADIRVHKELEELASDHDAYEKNAAILWEDPSDWGISMGKEIYTVGGCKVCFPPEKELTISSTFVPGDTIAWHDCQLKVIDLAIHGWYACGFLLKRNGENIALFIGDLFCDGAQIISYFDLTVCYGGTTLNELPAALDRILDIDVSVYVPATGPLMQNGPDQAKELKAKLNTFSEACRETSPDFKTPESPDYTVIGPWRKFEQGIYQNTSFGNTIVFIDNAGRSLIVDPGPCDFEVDREQQFKNFHKAMDILESECGLRTVEWLLITHIHGDHYDMVPLLQERYGAGLAAWSPLADVIEDPESYPYSCLMPWYDVGITKLSVDARLERSEPWVWNDIDIETTHVPGHCNIGAAYILEFNGRTIAITGDQIQCNGEAVGFGGVPTNDYEPFNEGPLLAFENMVGRGIDLNIGGHGSSFLDCEAVYQESLEMNRRALYALAPILRGNDYDTIFRSKEIRDARKRFSID